jgi:ribosomal small subunit protein bTHX
MGKGDLRSKRGKIHRGTTGKTRKKGKRKPAPRPAAAASPEPAPAPAAKPAKS